ncbi:MAG: PilZ domain-containing protein [Polyangia bacterium]
MKTARTAPAPRHKPSASRRTVATVPRSAPCSGPPRSGPPRSGPPRSAVGPAAVAGALAEKRRTVRFDKAFPVAVRSDSHGETCAVARNISAGGMMIEAPEPLPLGTRVQVFFSMPDSHARIVARGEVKNHYFLNFAGARGAQSLTGMGVRFTSFESDTDLLLGLGVTRLRTVLH